MEQFIISPDDCLILRAFKATASLREAAKLLNCDPAGLQRKTQRISEEYGYLQKIKGRWGLTDSGMALVGWVEESIITQKKLLLGNSSIRISSTTWMIEQFLIPNSAKLQKSFAKGTKLQFTTPGKNFEAHLVEGSCDFVIVCHPPEDPAIAHRQLFKEEWIVVVPANWNTKKLKFEDLMNKPFIRHDQINPDIFQMNAALLSEKTIITVDNLIAVRSAVLHGQGWSIVPRLLMTDLLKGKDVVIIPHEINMDRRVCVWWLRRSADSKKISNQICHFIQESYSKIS